MLRAAKPYLFLAPIFVFAIGFVYYPFLKTALHSVSAVNARGQITDFTGLANFAYLFSRRDFHAALQNTLTLTAVNVPVTLILTLALALLSGRRRRLSPVYETLFSLPMAVSMATAALIFKVLLNPTVGYVNYALGLQIGWYESRAAAMPGILLLTVWMGIGFEYLLFLSAVRSVPDQLMEAATLDGANGMQRLFRVQLPLMTPTILYVSCNNLVLAMMTSGPVIILTQGGPSRATTTLIYMMYASGYGSSDYSLAACVSMVAFALTFGFTVLAFLLENRGVHYQ